ncbi:MAG: peptidase, partial [Gammaproteobacteria bacterium]|nr:peptidase [Gammaproteobacteria bacterium]
AQNAFLITSVLHDTIQRGTAKEARSLQRNDLSGKTGTTQNQVDAWFAGYNSELVVVTWVGFDQQQRSLHEFGATAALPMWMQFMQLALQGHPDHPMPQPPGIVSVRIDPQTGKRAASNDPLGAYEYFMFPYIPDDDQNTVAENKPMP